ncbi:MAG: adenylyl-sulfate kinase [Bacteroidales bacterium]|nr:adenylyl-sulfate kinase [Bacteroidales bacterium]
MDIKAYLDQDQKKDLLRLLTAGSVDDGKSTLIGRLLFDSRKLYEDQLSALERDSKREGHAGGEIDYALLLDGLKAEREQGITIDVAYRYFSTARRKFIIADTPGHEQYTRNMITGGSTANLAILLVDARKGVITQTRRHSYLVSLLGLRHVVVAVNKMDLVDYKQEVFESICEDYHKFVTQLDIPDIHFIPLSALKGDNVVDISDKMPWYHGKSLLEFLETVHVTSDRNFEELRYPVQYVIRPDLQYRGFAGRVASGIIRTGDEVMVLPSRKTTTVTAITSPQSAVHSPQKNEEGGRRKEEFSEHDSRPTSHVSRLTSYAFPPQSVSLTLTDEIDISRGDMLVHPGNLPRIGRSFEAMLVWMDEAPMDPYTQFYIKQTTNTTKARIETIRYRVDVNTLEKPETDHFKLNEIGRVVMTTVKPLFFDAYKKNRNTGSFVLIDPVTHNTVAVGMILDAVVTKLEIRNSKLEISHIVQGNSLINSEEREGRLHQKGATIWITGLHGSGKNEVAYGLERRLFDIGATTVLLDGKSVRSGLSRELDFSPADRAEHLRRVAHICKLLNDQGIITICSFISPDENIRQQVSGIIGQERFYLVYLKSDIDFAKKNDKYGLYALAEEGKVENLPGIDSTYDEPINPAIVLEADSAEDKTDKIIHFLERQKIIG